MLDVMHYDKVIELNGCYCIVIPINTTIGKEDINFLLTMKKKKEEKVMARVN